MLISSEIDINREIIRAEVGEMAKQADGSVLLTCGKTSVLATVVSSVIEEDKFPGYFPLQVSYSERYYAAGKIPGGFIKREGKPRDKEVLVSRLIDRSIRPMFPEDLLQEVQVIVMTLSVDGKNLPDILAVNAASAALSVSDCPFLEPVAAVRVGYIAGEYLVNPSLGDLRNSKLDLFLSATEDKVVMLEVGGSEIEEDKIVSAIEYGHEYIRKLISMQKDLQSKCGKQKHYVKISNVKNIEGSEELRQKMAKQVHDFFLNFSDYSQGRIFFDSELEKLWKNMESEIIEKFDKESLPLWKRYWEELEKQILNQLIVSEKRRVDGRTFDELRNIDCKIEVFPRTHGSALFTRGETQSLAIVTLGTPLEVQHVTSLEGEDMKRFMLHYNFQPFSVGEIGRKTGSSRREIGHGSLAEKALSYVFPNEADFPYTVRVVSDILESNGSSSMASVCSASLSLLDAGVPIQSPVAGIAMGLAFNEEEEVVLTDIQGIEDRLGSMDCKVAGTKNGITAIQLDIKMPGIKLSSLSIVLERAKSARLQILDTMNSVIEKEKSSLSEYAPKISLIHVPYEKMREIIGPQGRMIRHIIEQTKADLVLSESGKMMISSKESSQAKAAQEMVEKILNNTLIEPNKKYKGTVTKVADIGAFIEVYPGKEGLCHISNIANKRIRNIRDHINEGDKVDVLCLSIDSLGRYSFSIKHLDPNFSSEEDKSNYHSRFRNSEEKPYNNRNSGEEKPYNSRRSDNSSRYSDRNKDRFKSRNNRRFHRDKE